MLVHLTLFYLTFSVCVSIDSYGCLQLENDCDFWPNKCVCVCEFAWLFVLAWMTRLSDSIVFVLYLMQLLQLPDDTAENKPTLAQTHTQTVPPTGVGKIGLRSVCWVV